MQKIIDGKLYDTETATRLCDVSNGSENRSDFGFDDTTLYRSPRGQHFIAGDGGARSRWAKPVDGGLTGGSGLRLVDEAQARGLVEKYGSPELYAEHFGDAQAG